MSRTLNVRLHMTSLGRARVDTPLEVTVIAFEGPAAVLGRHMTLEMADAEALWLAKELVKRLARVSEIHRYEERILAEQAIETAVRALISTQGGTR